MKIIVTVKDKGVDSTVDGVLDIGSMLEKKTYVLKSTISSIN